MLRKGGYMPLDWLLVGLAAGLPLAAWLSGFWSDRGRSRSRSCPGAHGLDPILVWPSQSS